MSKKKAQVSKKECTKCGKERSTDRDYYYSNSSKYSDNRITVCKQCILKDLDTKNKTKEELFSTQFLHKIQDVLLDMNRPFIYKAWEESVSESEKRNMEIFGVYLKNISLNHRNKDWRDSVFFEGGLSDETTSKHHSKKDSPKKKLGVELDTKNEKDVLRLLGYDPFEHELDDDRHNLFNKLIDYLDESTLEDGFRLTSVIEIVRTFNQMDRINAAISKNMGSASFSKNPGSVTSLVTAKDKMMKSILDIAKENTISLKHSSNKSKGAGTLSGIIKQLEEYDIHEAGVNLFDISTAEGIKQVADLSNKSIMQQLQFDENDYSSMLQEQREMLEENIEKANKFEEENRKLRVELIKREGTERKLRGKIKELENNLNTLMD